MIIENISRNLCRIVQSAVTNEFNTVRNMALHQTAFFQGFKREKDKWSVPEKKQAGWLRKCLCKYSTEVFRFVLEILGKSKFIASVIP